MSPTQKGVARYRQQHLTKRMPTTQPTSAPGPECVDALTRSLDQALGLLRSGRYAELSGQLGEFEHQAQALGAWKRALQSGMAAPAGMRASCERLGRRLVVFSEVARQVATLEFGVLQLVTGPRDSSYGRDGLCGVGEAPSAGPGNVPFEREA
jgi:hypothetical protein